MRPLVISAEQQAAVDALVKFASDPENWYRPFKDKWIPGDRIEYAVHLDTYRCVFTYTQDLLTKRLYRHLSISVPGDDYPNPIAASQIAKMFGFTGGKEENGICVHPGEDWLAHINKEEGCVVLAQEIHQ